MIEWSSFNISKKAAYFDKIYCQHIGNTFINIDNYYSLNFHSISQSSEQNKMTSHNLAVVFGPTLFRVPENENLLTSQGQINAFVGILISEFYQIFPDEPSEKEFDDNIDGDGKLSADDGIEDDTNQTEDELSDDGKILILLFLFVI